MTGRRTAWPQRHPRVASACLFMFVVAGFAVWPRLAVDPAPLRSGTSLFVVADMPGVPATLLESDVLLPLEAALHGLTPMPQTTARSEEGRVRIELRFGSAAERAVAQPRVEARLIAARSRLPDDLAPPTLGRDEPPPRAAAVYAIVTDEITAEHLVWAEQSLRRAIQVLPGARAAILDGADSREILLQPNPRRLATLGLSFDAVLTAVRRSADGAQRETPVNLDALAARSVVLSDGEAIPLSEVAELSLTTRVNDKPLHRGRPALMLRVIPVSLAEAAPLAERVHAHIGWLVANGMVPSPAQLENLVDAARERRAWLGRLALVAGVFFLTGVLLVLALFGLRAAFAASAAALGGTSAALALLWVTGVTLTPMSCAGIVGAGLATLSATVFRFGPAVMLFLCAIAAAIASGWPAELPGVPAPAAAGLALALAAGTLAAWFACAWQLSVPAARWRRRIAAVVLPVALIASTVVAARMLAASSAMHEAWVLRVQGDEASAVEAMAADLLPRFGVIRDLDAPKLSCVREESWTLELDRTRARDAGIGLAEVGRAFAVARAGVVVADVVDADMRLPLRVQLAPDASGTNFERLLLRGETDEHPALYLSSVGAAVRTAVARERLRVDGRPAAEILLRWRTPQARSELARVRDALRAPTGFAFSWFDVETSAHSETRGAR